MFYEDDQRLKEREKAKKPLSPLRRRLGLGFKISLILAVLAGLTLVVLSSVGGNDEALRLGLQDYLSTASGHRAEVGRLNDARFFPFLKIDAEDIRFYRRQEEKELSVARVQAMNVSLSFKSNLLRRASFETLDITGFSAGGGVFTRHPFDFEKILVKEKQGSENPVLSIEGRYKDAGLSAEIGMVKKISGKRTLYSFPHERPFYLKAGDVEITGRMEDKPFGNRRIAFSRAALGERAARGYFDVREWLGGQRIGLEIFAGESRITGAIGIRRGQAAGSLRASVLDLEDAKTIDSIVTAATGLWPFDAGMKSAVFDVAVDDLKEGATSFGAVSASVTMDDRGFSLYDALTSAAGKGGAP